MTDDKLTVRPSSDERVTESNYFKRIDSIGNNDKNDDMNHSEEVNSITSTSLNNRTEQSSNNSYSRDQSALDDQTGSPQSTKPKAIVEPMKKKIQFPVIKRKKLMNPNTDYL